MAFRFSAISRREFAIGLFSLCGAVPGVRAQESAKKAAKEARNRAREQLKQAKRLEKERLRDIKKRNREAQKRAKQLAKERKQRRDEIEARNDGVASPFEAETAGEPGEKGNKKEIRVKQRGLEGRPKPR